MAVTTPFVPSNHAIWSTLIELGIATKESFKPYFPMVRDRMDIRVLRCEQSGVIILDRTDHIQKSYYSAKKELEYWNTLSYQNALNEGGPDAELRADKIGALILNKKWLDVGTGVGAIIKRLGSIAKEAHVVEPQQDTQKELKNFCSQVYTHLEEVPDNYYDVITLFHVFEHVLDPIEFLQTARKKMAVGGRLVCEVPHARDFLIAFLDLDAFKRFTFWSEHLVLHTRKSLEVFLRAGGLSGITIEGHQRYSIANHLHWLAKGTPGGHVVWNFLQDKTLETAYNNRLGVLDMTDTLFAFAAR